MQTPLDCCGQLSKVASHCDVACHMQFQVLTTLFSRSMRVCQGSWLFRASSFIALYNSYTTEDSSQGKLPCQPHTVTCSVIISMISCSKGTVSIIAWTQTLKFASLMEWIPTSRAPQGWYSHRPQCQRPHSGRLFKLVTSFQLAAITILSRNKFWGEAW